MDRSIRAISDNVILAPVEDEIESETIVIPERSKRPSETKLKVVSLGAKTKRLRKGDVVLVSPHKGTEIKAGISTLLIIKEDDVLATVEP